MIKKCYASHTIVRITTLSLILQRTEAICNKGEEKKKKN